MIWVRYQDSGAALRHETVAGRGSIGCHILPSSRRRPLSYPEPHLPLDNRPTHDSARPRIERWYKVRSLFNTMPIMIICCLGIVLLHTRPTAICFKHQCIATIGNRILPRQICYENNRYCCYNVQWKNRDICTLSNGRVFWSYLLKSTCTFWVY